MGRKIARETVMQVFYQMEMQKNFELDSAKKYVEGVVSNKKDKDYIFEMIQILVENREKIDRNIRKNLKGWKFDRISKVDLSILRVAIAEILFKDDIPVKVSINEAIEIAKKYGSEESANFISGLLGTLADKVFKNE